MTTEEITLNPALEAAGMEVIETDLGEYIVQLRHEPPSHIITPAIHLSKEDIGNLFPEQFGIPYTPEPEKLTAEARTRLREIFLARRYGNHRGQFRDRGDRHAHRGRERRQRPNVLAQCRKFSSRVMGIEKVIPKLADLRHFLEILARTATGQKLTTYTNFIRGPRAPGELDGPREMHVVILDNGRSAMLADPVLREALLCIRCGACLNVCPVYRHIGGHAYLSPYPDRLVRSSVRIWSVPPRRSCRLHRPCAARAEMSVR